MNPPNPPAISIFEQTGSFAENKDTARRLREDVIIPALRSGQAVAIDFSQVTGATQSFIHALISGPIRQFRALALDNLLFENCNPEVRAVIRIVFAYMQESMDDS